MVDKLLFKLAGAKKIMVKLVVLYVLQAFLIIGQSCALGMAITNLWKRQSLGQQLWLVLAFVICFASREALNTLAERRLDVYARGRARDLRNRLLKKIFALGPSLVQKVGTGHMVTTTLDGIDQVETYIKLIFSKSMRMMVVPVILLLAAVYLDWISAVIMLLVYPLVVLFMIILGYAAQDRANAQFQEFTMLSNHFIDSLRGIATLRYFGLSKRYSKSIYTSSERFRVATMKTMRVAVLSTFALDFFTTLSIAIIAVSLGIRLIDGKMLLFPALTILILAPEYFQPIRVFANDFHATLNGKNAFHEIAQIIHTKEPAEPKVALHKWGPDDQLVAKNVSFAYPQGAQIAPLNFSLKGPMKVGIIGMSGSGKTTLINLLAGFLQPAGGHFTIQGRETKTMNLKDWRKQILYIPQDPYIFNDTLRNNIKFYTPDVSDQEVMKAIHVVGLDQLLASLPNGLDTQIGHGQRTFSGGQAQRIALARAFLDDQRKVMIFDEPTAHLDIETELELKDRMLPLMKGRLVLFATHRLHWVDQFDYLLVMKHGQLVEQGTPQDLLAKGGYFKQLVAEMRR